MTSRRKLKNYKITEKEQIAELNNRVPPLLNIDIVIVNSGRFLVGKRTFKGNEYWQFPGSRVRFDETPQGAADRILKNEAPGVKATFKKLINAVDDYGLDPRGHGITLHYLYEYVSGTPKESEHFLEFKWLEPEEILKLKNIHPIEIKSMSEIEAAVREMHTSEDEILVEVDDKNEIVGEIVKRDAHSDPSRYHRSAFLFIFNSKNEIVLQQRCKSKSVGAGKWDMHGGHQVAGHTIEQTARQELAEELGIDAKLKLHRVGLYQDDMQSEWYYVFYGFHDGPYGFDRNEVDQVRAFDCQKLLDGDYDSEYDIYEHVKEFVEELKFVWNDE